MGSMTCRGCRVRDGGRQQRQNLLCNFSVFSTVSCNSILTAGNLKSSLELSNLEVDSKNIIFFWGEEKLGGAMNENIRMD